MNEHNRSHVTFNQGRALCKIAGEYPTLYESIMEAVQNAIDANATEINIVLNRKSQHLAIRDNGDGVTMQEFEVALSKVCESVKERGKLGQFGIGLISPLGKCKYFTFISSPSRARTEGYVEWKFVTDDIRAQALNVTVPHRQRVDLVSKAISSGGTRRDVTAVEWNTQLEVFGYTKDKVINKIPSAEELLNGIVDRYGAAMRRNNVQIGVAIINEDGSHDLKAGSARPFTGKKLPEKIIRNKDGGATTIRLYLARKTAEKGYRGKVSVGEADNDFRFAFSTFARSVPILASELVDALTSGIFEGEILSEKARLHANRRSFVEGEALYGFCDAIEAWFKEEGEGHLEQIQGQREDERLQELGLQSMRNLEQVLKLPMYAELNKVINSFKRGTVGENHTLPSDAAVLGKQKEKSLAVQGAGNGAQEDSDHKGDGEVEKPNHHPYTVAGPKGQRRTIVKSDSLGLQFSHTAMEGSDRLFELDIRNGVLHFNIRHPVWVACDRDGKGNRQLRQLQEFITIQALELELMPPDWRKYIDLFVNEVMNPFGFLIQNSRSYTFTKTKVDLKE